MCPFRRLKQSAKSSVREWSIRRFLAARMVFFLCHFRTICSFYYIILLFITQVKYPAAIVHVMISKNISYINKNTRYGRYYAYLSTAGVFVSISKYISFLFPCLPLLQHLFSS